MKQREASPLERIFGFLTILFVVVGFIGIVGVAVFGGDGTSVSDQATEPTAEPAPDEQLSSDADEPTFEIDSQLDTKQPGTKQSEPSAQPDNQPAEQAEAEASEAQSYVPFTDLDVIDVGDLPVEAWDTLDLIAEGGPYPYDQDDSTFQNREGILPDQDRGYYREYTVDTPGLNHRGARRIVAGDAGELFYTSDHYESFSEIGY